MPLPATEAPSTVRPLDWSSYSSHDRLAIFNALVGKLSRLHGAGFAAGDTSLSNLVLLRGRDPHFRSAGQLTRLDEKNHGLPELFYLLCELRKKDLVDDKAVHALLAYYLKADSHAIEHARAFLISRSNKSRPYRPGIPLTEQLHAWFLHYYQTFHSKEPAGQN